MHRGHHLYKTGISRLSFPFRLVWSVFVCLSHKCFSPTMTCGESFPMNLCEGRILTASCVRPCPQNKKIWQNLRSPPHSLPRSTPAEDNVCREGQPSPCVFPHIFRMLQGLSYLGNDNKFKWIMVWANWEISGELKKPEDTLSLDSCGMLSLEQ